MPSGRYLAGEHVTPPPLEHPVVRLPRAGDPVPLHEFDPHQEPHRVADGRPGDSKLVDQLHCRESFAFGERERRIHPRDHVREATASSSAERRPIGSPRWSATGCSAMRCLLDVSVRTGEQPCIWGGDSINFQKLLNDVNAEVEAASLSRSDPLCVMAADVRVSLTV